MNGQTKSEAPRLTEIAAQILSGLLASGDYTEGSEHFKPVKPYDAAPRPSYRPEAVYDAIELAQMLQTLCEKQGSTSSLAGPAEGTQSDLDMRLGPQNRQPPAATATHPATT